jgi:hypothetical protein
VGAFVVEQLSRPEQDSPSVAADPAYGIQAKATWPNESLGARFVQLEKHLCGLDVSMAEIGCRYDELLKAVNFRNWDYAKNQIEKIDSLLRLLIERKILIF